MRYIWQLHIPIACILVNRCWLIKKCLASNTHKLYATAVETIWVKQCTETGKTLRYFNFEAFDFTIEMHLYYIHIYHITYGIDRFSLA